MLPLRVTRLTLRAGEVLREPAGVLYDAVAAHLRAPHGAGLVVLGAFGSGKSSLCARIADDEASIGRPITMVRLATLSPHEPVADALERAVGRARLAEIRDGRRVVLLDGFDEIPLDGRGAQRVFRDLLHAVGPHWVVTSRPGHFRTASPPDGLGDPDQVDPFEDAETDVLHIEPLDREVVRQVLADVHRGPELLRTVSGLEDLASSPLLLQVVLAAEPHIESGRPLYAWGLFDAWLRYALHTGPGHDDVLDRLRALAWDTFVASGHAPEALAFPPERLAEAELPRSLRRALLVTELDGRVRFGHRAVFEFLLASTIAPALAANQGRGPDAFTGLRLTDATRAFCVGRVGRMPVVVDGDRARIPRGNFIAGGTLTGDERPLRIAHLAQDVWIARTPVTGAEWAAYLADRPDDRVDLGYLPHWGQPRRLPEGHADLPVWDVWPDDADAYAAWRGARLPSADAWEKAVRGIDGRTWPWGDYWRPAAAVTAELGLDVPLPVRAFGAHGDAGLYAACGHVFEITGSAWRDRTDRGRVVMGGCFSHPADTARPSLRLSHRLSGRLKAGVRLAWDAEAPAEEPA